MVAMASKSRLEPSIAQERITPQLAQQWLSLMAKNRNVRKRWVAQIAADMRAGRYKMNPNPIAFDINEVLIDGQHRLLAIVESNTTQTMWVARNMPVESKDVIDSGKSRTVGDALLISHGIDMAHHKASACTVLRSFENESPMDRGLSAVEVLEIYSRYETVLDWSMHAIGAKMQPGVTSGGAPTRVVFALAKLVRPKIAEKTLRIFLTEEYEKEPDIPAHIVRMMRRAIVRPGSASSSHSSKVDRWTLFVKLLRGMEAILIKEELQNLKFDFNVCARFKKFAGSAMPANAEKPAAQVTLALDTE